MIFIPTFSDSFNEFPHGVFMIQLGTLICIEMKWIWKPISIINDTFWKMENLIFSDVTPRNFLLFRGRNFRFEFYTLSLVSPYGLPVSLQSSRENIIFKAWKTMKTVFEGG